jgi:hypothetical protein
MLLSGRGLADSSPKRLSNSWLFWDFKAYLIY